MKKFIVSVLAALTIMSVASCTDLFGPLHAEEPKIKEFVLSYAYSNGRSVEMVDWNWSGTQGETFTGYYVVYSVNSSEYIVLDLVEFDNGRCEYKFVCRSRSLSSIYEDYGF